LLAHVDIIMAAFMDNHQVLALPVVVIAIHVVKVYLLVTEKLGSTISTSMVLFSQQTCCYSFVKFGVSSTPVQDIPIIG
jgi:hypothetical protein